MEMKEKLQEERKFIPGIQKEEKDGLSVFYFCNVHRSHDACENWNITFSSLCFFFFYFFLSCFFISKNQFPRAVLIPFDPQPFFRELEEEELYVDLFLILIYVRSKRCFLR